MWFSVTAKLSEEKNMTYKEFIQNIIDTRGKHNITKNEYYEMHHIIPICLGGSGDHKRNSFNKNSKHENCIWLYAREHFIAHKLLAEENYNNKKLIYAWRGMWLHDSNQCRYEPTPEEYEQVRILSQKVIREDSLERWKNDEYRQKQKEKWTVERREKMSVMRKGKKASKETKIKMSVQRKGKQSKLKGTKASKKTKEKISLATSGKNNPMYNKKHSDATREKLRLKNIGKEIYWWNDGIKNTMSKDCPGEGWSRGRLSGFKHMSNKNYVGVHRGIAVKKFLWLLPDGTTKIADKGNTRRWHKDWTLIKNID